MTIEELDSAGAARDLPALAAVMRACVQGGASVNFVLPLSQADSEAWWRRTVLPALAAGERRLVVARVGGRVLGSVQLAFAAQPNQAHRADVTKLLVRPDGRRQGLARALMMRIETMARETGRSLITLDTREGDAAEALYRSLSYTLFGVVPRFARAPDAARLEAASFFYKELA